MARKYGKKAQEATQLALDTGCTALYIRVSTEKQKEEGFSLDDQQKRLTAHCVAQGWNVCEGHIYKDEGISGKTTEREDYQRMLQAARDGKIKRIVAVKLDRLARNVRSFLALVDELQAIGCDLILIKESFNTSTPQGKFAITMFAAMAELEASTITERVMSGKAQKASEGGYNGSRCPLGYTYANGKFELNERAETVRNVFTWFNDGASMNAIVRRLNSEGVPTATGKGSWVVHGIKHVLANGAYAGIAQWNDVEVQGSYPPIIDRVTYDAAQERLKNTTQGKRADLTISSLILESEEA